MRTFPGEKTTLILVLTVLWFFRAEPTAAHDHTRHAFEAAQRASRQKARDLLRYNNVNTCRLTISLTHSQTNEPLFGLVRITQLKKGDSWPLIEALERPMNWYAMPPQTTVMVPQTELKIEAIHGIDTELTVRVLDLTRKQTAAVKLPLVRFYSPEAQGVRSGNTHLHLILDSQKKGRRKFGFP